MKKVSSYFIMFLCLVSIVMFLEGNACSQDKPVAYWIDASSGARLQSIDIPTGGQTSVRLVVDIPAGKLLRAYNITVVYDKNLVSLEKSVTAPDSVMPPKYYNAGYLGALTFNGFDVSGIAGPVSISFIDLTLRGKARGSFDLVVAPNNFGTSSNEEFIPLTETMRLNVQ